MSTVIYPSPIFGPVRSRRLGVSLGINLLPSDGKWCSFDCVYCECGLNAERRAKAPLPTREEVLEALEARLREMPQVGPTPDVLTFAGNGEPTLHPDFPAIIDGVRALRDEYFPEAKMSILSNSTQIHRPEIRTALLHFDNNILKLDTVDAAYIARVDQPQGRYDVGQIVDHLCEFEGNVIIQTMFMTGTLHGESVDNTTEAYVTPWLEALLRIKPRQVMIYTIDRETPIKTLQKATPAQLDAIADRLRQAGLTVSVSY